MPLLVAPALVDAVTQGLLGAIDVDGGATDEQLAVLRAVVTYLWAKPVQRLFVQFVACLRNS